MFKFLLLYLDINGVQFELFVMDGTIPVNYKGVRFKYPFHVFFRLFS